MRRIKVKLEKTGVTLDGEVLGSVGEKGAVQLEIDIGGIAQERIEAAYLRYRMPDGVTLEGDTISLPDDGPLVVVVPDWAMSERGRVQMQLTLTGADKTVRSYVWWMRVLPSLELGGTPPEPVRAWLAQVQESIAQALDFCEAVSRVNVTAQTLEPGAQATASGSVSAQEGLQLALGLPTGATGPQGKKGDPGAVYTPSMTEDGTLSWSNDGGLPNPQSVNLRGPQGIPGTDGKDGATGPVGPQGDAGLDAPQIDDTQASAEHPWSGAKVDTEIKQAITTEQTAREAADNALRADLTANAEADAETKRSLDALWKLNQGISYQFETDEAEAYSKTAPSGAKLVSVESVGGKTVAWNQQMPGISKSIENNGITITIEGKHFIIVVDNPTGQVQVEGGKVNLETGHKYLYLLDKEIASGIEFYITGTIGIQSGRSVISTPNDNYIGKQSTLLYVGVNTANGTYEYEAGVFDLTQLFGSGNEPTSTDDPRIAWIEQYAEAHPEYNAGELVSAEVESVKHNDAVAAAIPDAVRALPGYGWSAGDVCNSIERTETGWQYVQRIVSADLGTLNYVYDTESVKGTPTFKGPVPSKKPGAFGCICVKYQYVGARFGLVNTEGIAYRNESTNVIHIRDDAYTDAAAFKSAVAGVMLYYEISEPITTDITDLMEDFPDNFEVEAGGTITLKNAAKLPVPSTEKYLIALAEVNQ